MMMRSLLLVLVAAMVIVCCARIPINQRKFTSPAVNALIANYTSRMQDAELATLFANCWPNCLDTTVASFTVDADGVPDAFIVTGDIDASWLRDSANQVMAYADLWGEEEHLRQLACGVIVRQSHQITIDPYANAFNAEDNWNGHQQDVRKPPMNGWLFEGKYSLDSLVAFLKLSRLYWQRTNDTSCFAGSDNGVKWREAVNIIIETITAQQACTLCTTDPPYTFMRLTYNSTDTTQNRLRGFPAAKTGMSKSFFRPSDDVTSLPFHVPSNMMAVVELGHVAQLLSLNSGPTANRTMASEAQALAAQLDDGVQRYASYMSPRGKAWAYEVDGFGSTMCMDDPNIPSLLSIPYIGYAPSTDVVYNATRHQILSPLTNPFYYSGTQGAGVGSTHTGPSNVWPMSIVMQGLTSVSDDEIMQCFQYLKASSNGDGFLHESYDPNDPSNFTRAWFAWVNTLFGQLILKVAAERPYLLFHS